LCFWLLFFSFSLHMLYFDTKMKREREREFPETKRAMCRLYQCACINISTPLCVCVWYLCVTIHVLKTQMTNNSKHASVHSERGGLSLLFQKHTLLAACILKTLFATKNNLLFFKTKSIKSLRTKARNWGKLDFVACIQRLNLIQTQDVTEQVLLRKVLSFKILL